MKAFPLAFCIATCATALPPLHTQHKTTPARRAAGVVGGGAAPAPLRGYASLAVAGGAAPAPLRGYASLAGGMLVHLVLGTLYCWGNFVSYVPPAMRRLDGAAAAPGSPGDALIAFPLTILVQCGTMPFGARAVERFGPRAATLGGGGLVALGVFLASFATTLRAFLACYSGLVGAGIALAYTAPLVAGWSWFPDARGFVNGAVLMGFGAGGFFFNLLGTRLANPGGVPASGGAFPDEIYANFPVMLRKLALVYGAVVAVGGSLVAPRPAAAAAAAAADRTPARAIVLSRNFGVLYAATVLCASAGLTSASVYKVFATTRGHGDGFLSGVGAVGALCNGLGRLAWGALVDARGFRGPFLAMLLAQAAVTAAAPAAANAGPRAFLATVAAAFFCLGGIFSMVPSAVGLLFGRGDAARAYALLFNAFAVASLGGVSAAKALIPRLGWPALYHALAAATLAAAGLTLLLDV